MPPPPLKSIPPIKYRRKHPITGVIDYLDKFEETPPKERVVQPTPKVLKEQKKKQREEDQEEKLAPLIEEYRKEQRECEGKYKGMNCYNTLFVGRLAYEVTERKLLREMEAFGPVHDIKLVMDKEGKSRGYGFVEYENEEDMKRAYRAADGMRIEGREIVVDVERGHTVPTWLPRRLGGGLGGTRYDETSEMKEFYGGLLANVTLFRLGGKEKNIRTPGRFDPNRPESRPPPMADGPPDGMGRGQGPPPMYSGSSYDTRDGPYGGYRDGHPPPQYIGGGYGGGPPPRRDYGGSSVDGGRRRRRSRSRSSERRYAPRPRY